MQSNKDERIFKPSSNKSLSWLITLYGSTDKGFVSQQFINNALGDESIEGVLLNGLVLN